jgi:hypothetical protein
MALLPMVSARLAAAILQQRAASWPRCRRACRLGRAAAAALRGPLSSRLQHGSPPPFWLQLNVAVLLQACDASSPSGRGSVPGRCHEQRSTGAGDAETHRKACFDAEMDQLRWRDHRH